MQVRLRYWLIENTISGTRRPAWISVEDVAKLVIAEGVLLLIHVFHTLKAIVAIAVISIHIASEVIVPRVWVLERWHISGLCCRKHVVFYASGLRFWAARGPI